jgi:hypothetical protein
VIITCGQITVKKAPLHMLDYRLWRTLTALVDAYASAAPSVIAQQAPPSDDYKG